MVSEDLKVNVPMKKCRWIKRYIMKHFQGDTRVEFKRLEDYAEEIRKSNISNNVELNIFTKDGKTNFKKMYVCFDAMREGFMTRCRRIIGVDGCFLKWPFKREILASVGKDANN